MPVAVEILTGIFCVWLCKICQSTCILMHAYMCMCIILVRVPALSFRSRVPPSRQSTPTRLPAPRSSNSSPTDALVVPLLPQSTVSPCWGHSRSSHRPGSYWWSRASSESWWSSIWGLGGHSCRGILGNCYARSQGQILAYVQCSIGDG